MSEVKITSDDDEVRVRCGNTHLSTSGKVIRMLLEDMIGTTVERYIKDAQLGLDVRLLVYNVEGKRG